MIFISIQWGDFELGVSPLALLLQRLVVADLERPTMDFTTLVADRDLRDDSHIGAVSVARDARRPLLDR